MQVESGNRRNHARFVPAIVLSGLLAAMTSVGAWIKVPFYPVPLTLQTLVTLFSGAVLPPNWAAASQGAYLLLGLLGLPVFAGGGGPHYLLQPTFGYLLALPPLAFFASRLFLRKLSFFRLTAALFGLQIIHLLFGAVWLKFVFVFVIRKNMSWADAFMTGTVLFLPAALIKAVVAAVLYSKLERRMLRSLQR